MSYSLRAQNPEPDAIGPAAETRGLRETPFAERPAPAAHPVFKLDIGNAIRRFPILFAATAGVLFALIIAAALHIRSTYDAQALVYVDPLPGKVLGEADGTFFDPSRYAAAITQDIQTATRADTLEQAVRSMPEGTWQMPGETVEHAAARLAGAVGVKRVGDTFQLAITNSNENPQKAAAIVNAVTDAFLSQGRRDANANTDERLKLLSDERTKLQQELEASHSEQAQLSTDLGEAVSTGTSTSNPYDAELSGTRQELIVAQQAHDAAVAALAAIRDPDGTPSPGLKAQAEEAAAGDGTLSALRTSVAQRRAQLTGQMAGMTPENSVYKADQAELSQMDAQVQARMAVLERQVEQRMIAKDELEVRRTGEIESRLRSQVATGTTAAGHAAPKLQRSAELSADIARLEARYAAVDEAMRALTLEETGPGAAHLSVPATAPPAPTASKRRLLLIAALPVSLIIALITVLVATRVQSQVLTAADLEAAAGFPAIAALPRRSEVSREAMEECLLRLAGSLERAHRSAGARSFLFAPVSAKTEVAELSTGLQRKLVELGFAVSRMDVDQLVNTSGVAGLASPGERLAAWTGTYDFVLFDAQALLRSAETEYAVRHVDATILLVESGLARRGEVTRSLTLLRRIHAAGVGIVLDRVPLRLFDKDLRASLTTVEARLPVAPAAWTYEPPSPADQAVNLSDAPEPVHTEPAGNAAVEPLPLFEGPHDWSTLHSSAAERTAVTPASETFGDFESAQPGSAAEASAVEPPAGESDAWPEAVASPAEPPAAVEPIHTVEPAAEAANESPAEPVVHEAEPSPFAASGELRSRPDAILPAWLAEALERASAAGVPFDRSLPPARRAEPVLSAPEPVASVPAIEEPVAAQAHLSLIAWGVHTGRESLRIQKPAPAAAGAFAAAPDYEDRFEQPALTPAEPVVARSLHAEPVEARAEAVDPEVPDAPWEPAWARPFYEEPPVSAATSPLAPEPAAEAPSAPEPGATILSRAPKPVVSEEPVSGAVAAEVPEEPPRALREPLPPAETPTLVYERPVFSERVASAEPRPLPLPAEAPRPRETGRVMAWNPRQARVRPGIAPGQRGIYGPGQVYGNPSLPTAQVDETPLRPANSAGDDPSPEDGRRWQLLRRFDPRSRLFMPRPNEVPTPTGYETDELERDQISERPARNGSGK